MAWTSAKVKNRWNEKAYDRIMTTMEKRKEIKRNRAFLMVTVAVRATDYFDQIWVFCFDRPQLCEIIDFCTFLNPTMF